MWPLLGKIWKILEFCFLHIHVNSFHDSHSAGIFLCIQSSNSCMYPHKTRGEKWVIRGNNCNWANWIFLQANQQRQLTALGATMTKVLKSVPEPGSLTTNGIRIVFHKNNPEVLHLNQEETSLNQYLKTSVSLYQGSYPIWKLHLIKRHFKAYRERAGRRQLILEWR